MATYTNLASLEGLQVGDVVNYTITTAFDAKGYKFKAELYGKKRNVSNGGYTKFLIDTSILPATILSFNSRGDLIYGNTTSVNYRIGVAGDAGSSYGSYNGGLGGGSSGGNSDKGNYGYFAGGGSQTAGGSGRGANGGFGTEPKASSINGTVYYGGYGWYSGGCGMTYGTPTASGGGSGFIIGVSTTIYPSGYLNNDTDLRNALTQSISEGTLTQGGSSSYSAKMTITIVSKPSGANTQSTLPYYNGTEFINTNAKYYNGTEFVDCDVHYYNGNEFVKIGG